MLILSIMAVQRELDENFISPNGYKSPEYFVRYEVSTK